MPRRITLDGVLFFDYILIFIWISYRPSIIGRTDMINNILNFERQRHGINNYLSIYRHQAHDPYFHMLLCIKLIYSSLINLIRVNIRDMYMYAWSSAYYSSVSTDSTEAKLLIVVKPSWLLLSFHLPQKFLIEIMRDGR